MPVRASLILALSWAVSAYLWLVPLWRPRGYFLWGHYRLVDIYAGVVAALVALCTTIVLAAPHQHRRRLAVGLTMACCSAAAVLLSFDLLYALGITGAWRPNSWLDRGHISRRYNSADDQLGFVRKPLTVWRGRDLHGNLMDYRTDENGFRNPPGIRRADVVFVGDSFTEAAFVADAHTFVRRVEAATGLGAVNLGRGGYGPPQEAIVLDRYALTYRPRVIVWQLFEGNDLTDAWWFAEWTKDPRKFTVPLANRYFRNSPINQLLLATRRPLYPPSRDAVPTTVRYDDGPRQVALRYPLADDAGLNPAGFRVIEEAIASGARLCASRGVDLLVLFIPTMSRVLQPFMSLPHANGHGQTEQAAPLRLQSEFASRTASVCREVGCSFVDASDALRQRALRGNTRVYDRDDPDEHLGIAGHDTIAAVVTDWLRSRRHLRIQ